MSPTRQIRSAGSIVAAVVAVGLLAGCGGASGGSSSSSGGVRDSGGVAVGGVAKAPGLAPAGNTGNTGSQDSEAAKPATNAAAADLVDSRRLVLTANLDLAVADVFQTAGKVRAIATGAGGYVGDEHTQAAAPGVGAESTLTLRVPSAQLSAVTDRVAALGTVETRGENSDDVTQQSVDVTSRLATQRASVARVRALLAQATKISDVVLIEGELSDRESALESLEAQLKSLNDSVDLATLAVTLAPHGVKKAVPAGTGFVSGLHRGWDAFVGALVVALTVFGALLPFAVVLVALGIPVLVLWRRRRPIRPAVPAVPALPEA
jgi:hypothetical protein